MILHGNERGGARDLAIHLMKPQNEHIQLHSLRGFACGDLMGSFRESEALAAGTRCRQHLFSMSFNPPPGREVSTDDFEWAVAQAEEKLGLNDQPRAMVFMRRKAAGIYDGLNHPVVTHWLCDRICTVEKTHFDYVLAVWQDVPDNPFADITSEQLSALQSAARRFGLTPEMSIRWRTGLPGGRSVSKFKSILSGETKTARASHISVLERIPLPIEVVPRGPSACLLTIPLPYFDLPESRPA